MHFLTEKLFDGIIWMYHEVSIDYEVFIRTTSDIPSEKECLFLYIQGAKRRNTTKGGIYIHKIILISSKIII